MKLLYCFFVLIFYYNSNQNYIVLKENMLNKKNDNKNDSVIMKYDSLHIDYFDMIDSYVMRIIISRDSLKTIKEQGIKITIRTDYDLEIKSKIEKYVDLFVVKSINPVIKYPEDSKLNVETEKEMVKISVWLKDGEKKYKKIIKEPKNTYSKEFIEFFKLLNNL